MGAPEPVEADTTWGVVAQGGGHDVRVSAPGDRRPLRVLLVADVGGVRFGAGRSLVELACRLSQLPNVHVVVGAPQPDALHMHLAPAGIAVVRCPAPTWVLYGHAESTLEQWQRFHRLVVIGRSMRRVAALLVRLDPDVVVTNNSIIASTPLAATALGVPHVWVVRELVGERAEARAVVPTRLWRHLLDRLSTRVVANSSTTAAALTPPVRAGNITVVEPGCEVPPADEPVACPPTDRPLRLLTLGQFSEHKGAATLLRGLRMVVDAGVTVEVRVVGEDMLTSRDARVELDRLCEEGIVVFVGPVRNPLEEIDRADVVLMCSGIEGFGRVTVEALRRGRAVVAAAGGATPSIIRDGSTGILFPPDDPEALAAALMHLDDDRDAVARLGAAALADTAERFLPEEQAALFSSVLYEVAGIQGRCRRFRLARWLLRRRSKPVAA